MAVPRYRGLGRAHQRVSARDGGLSAPIEKDSVIGTVELWYSNSCLTEAQLLAQQP